MTFEKLLNPIRISFIEISFLFLSYLYMLWLMPNYVVKLFSNQGFTYDFSIQRTIVGVGLFLISVLSYLIIKTGRQRFFTFFILLVLVVPNLVLFQVSNAQIGITLSMMLILFASIIPIKWPELRLSLSTKMRNGLIVSLILALASILIYDFGIIPKLASFSLGEAQYAIRSQVRNSTSWISSYSFSLVSQYALPFMILTSIMAQKKALAFLFSLLLVYLFMLNPHKTVLFNIFLMLILFGGTSHRAKLLSLMSVLLILSILGRIESQFAIDGKGWIESLFYRRFLLLPARLNSCFFEVFQNQQIKLSHSILKHWLDYPFELQPPYLVCEHCLGSAEGHANNGLFSDGFMNFGWAGVIAWSLGVGLLLNVVSTLRTPSHFVLLDFVFLNFLKSTAFLTVMLTHGGWFYLILVLLLSMPLKDE
jgi:hypothetical protein